LTGQRDAHAWLVSLTANVAQRVLFPNPKRKSAIVFNNSASDIYLGFHSWVRTSGALQGMIIRAGGGKWSTSEPEVYTGEVWLISAASVDINIIEEVELSEGGKKE